MNPTPAKTPSAPGTTSSAAATASTAPPPTPGTPDTPDTRPPRPAKSHSAANSVSSTHREYLDSLHVPSKDEFRHIAEVQAAREAEHKRRDREIRRRSTDASSNASTPLTSPNPEGAPRQSHRRSFLSRLGFGHRPSPSEDGRQKDAAATLIQRTYRGYRARREMKGLSLDASARWVNAVQEAQWRALTRPRARSELHEGGFAYFGRGSSDGGGGDHDGNDDLMGYPSPSARSRWKKASTVARRAGGDADKSSSSSSSSSSSDSESDEATKEQRRLKKQRREEAKAKRKKDSKTMGLQYFLEMVDLKHRYGANLKVYHEAWQQADTKENFFYWLDHGEGRLVDIEVCPRETLEREQVRYLSREERAHYLVNVDDEGRLCWAKNGARIDTTEKWKDSVKGIVPSDDQTPAYAPVAAGSTNFLGTSSCPSSSSTSTASSSSFSSSSSDSEDDRRGQHYATPEYSRAKGVGKIKHVSATTILNKLLRKSVRKNTWIFVADTSFRLYVGIKNSGAFQHSSFLQGSRISAAGLIKIRDGRLHSLSPLSGHYRPPASNFRAFVKSLKEEGVDMSRVSISKSYAVLVGLEAYTKVRKRVGKVGEKKKKKEIGKELEEQERQIAQKEERMREENGDEVRVLRGLESLGVGVREPKVGSTGRG